ncbi:MAG: 5-methyltetrahydropteroyltriglutamate--homocysteine S-methyltransferase [Lachnospiraceae bacterium]|nr:5-methyltetrahydropteroyltriglutamate--homocysteine S-methyltransferase [Lachnospiraceae bacterium]
MKTSVIGFPRIGKNRELKFVIEKYFKGEATLADLQKEGRAQREFALTVQNNAGIDHISSNDFSYYDGVLDTALQFNIIPKRYKDLGLSPLDTYFAMARGYQGEKGNVKALAMKKWFNTNYHYIVPEIEDDAYVILNGTKIFDEYDEATSLGIKTKPVILGPFTFLKLARFTGKKTIKDFIDDFRSEYVALVKEFDNLGAEWIQFDEPYLVKDLSAEDIELFKSLYEKILSVKGNVKILLQTYFGDTRDIYPDLVQMKFDGLGLDFVEGRRSYVLVEKNGFPDDKILFAGLINGKNIWRNDYAKTLSRISSLKRAGVKNIVLSTSCSLLHVPYTTKSETKLSSNYLRHFAYAVEKLEELVEVAKLAEAKDESEIVYSLAYGKNRKLFEAREGSKNDEVRNRVAAIKDSDYTRLPEFAEREKIQKELLKLPIFPTTTIGSFPQTQDVKKGRTLLKRGEITKQEYDDLIREKIADCIKIQEEIGLDVLVHGEYERNDMVEYFGENLEGYLFTEKAWVQSYGTRCVKPPIIWGDVYRKNAITVDWSVYTKSLTDKPVKGMLTGPVTILNWSFPREDITIKESTLQIALAIRDEVLDLEAHGIGIIQIDEAALREKLPLRKSDWDKEYLDWAIPAFRLVASGVKPETQIHTHMCYSEFTDIIPAIDAMDADVITFEASRSDLQILDALKENDFRTEVGPGVYDIHSPRVPSVDEIYSALKLMREKLDDSKLWVNPDCGLKTRGETETKASLINLVEAAKKLREDVK